MAATLPSPNDCNCDCTTTCVTTQVPGPQGPPGQDGTDGIDGLDAVSLVEVMFAIPAQQASVLVTFMEPPGSEWMVVGQVVAVEGAGSGGTAGYYLVQSTTGTGQATLFNLRDDTTGAYAQNIDGAGNIVAGMKVSPGGVQGPAISAGGGGAGGAWIVWEDTGPNPAGPPADPTKPVMVRFRDGNPPVVWDPDLGVYA